MPWQLVIILVAALAVRLPYLFSPFVRLEEWGCSMFSVYAVNYQRLGFWESGLYPVFGKIGEQSIPYVNHPPGGALLLGLWAALFGTSEASSRVLAILVSLLTIVLVYLLARALFSARAGLVAAAFYAFMPLSIYMGRVYSMEPPQYLLFLASLYATWRWLQKGSGKWLSVAAVSLLLSAFTDFYPIYLTPLYFLFGLLEKERTRKPGWLLLACLPPLVVAGHVAYLNWWDWLFYMGQGGSKYARPWEYWVRPDYYLSVGRRLLLFLGWIPTLLVPLGIWKNRPQGRALWLLALLWGMALIDFVVLGRAVLLHPYRVLFFMVPVAVTAAAWLAERSNRTVAVAFVVFLALSWYPTRQLFQPVHPNDYETALSIRELTTGQDILIGLPPHMTYYTGRLAVVPYYFLWRHRELYGSPDRLMAELLPFAHKKGYERIVLFTTFLTDSEASIEWHRTYEGVPWLERVTHPSVDPQVWEFRSTGTETEAADSPASP